MNSGTPLDEWLFLVGDWRGKSSEGQFDEEGVVESTAVFSTVLRQGFLMCNHEARNKDRVIHQSISILFFDKIAKIFRRKSFFSYGFVNNETEFTRSVTEIRFEITFEPIPRQFEGTRWRSYIRKISETEIAEGLEVAKGEGDFKLYGETRLKKVV